MMRGKSRWAVSLGGEVEGGAIVPEGHGARIPAEADHVLGARDLLDEHLEQEPALGPGRVDDVLDVVRVDVQHAFAGRTAASTGGRLVEWVP
jgi:hypothetical protein